MEMYTRLKIYRYSVITVFLLGITTLNAQYSPEFLKYSKLYPEASRVRLHQETIITIEANKEGLEINQKFIEEDLYLNESATYNSKSRLNFSAFFELGQITAESLIYDGGKYVATEVEKFTEKDELYCKVWW